MAEWTDDPDIEDAQIKTKQKVSSAFFTRFRKLNQQQKT